MGTCHNADVTFEAVGRSVTGRAVSVDGAWEQAAQVRQAINVPDVRYLLGGVTQGELGLTEIRFPISAVADADWVMSNTPVQITVSRNSNLLLSISGALLAGMAEESGELTDGLYVFKRRRVYQILYLYFAS